MRARNLGLAACDTLGGQGCWQVSQVANVCWPVLSDVDLLMRNTSAWDQL